MLDIIASLNFCSRIINKSKMKDPKLSFGQLRFADEKAKEEHLKTVSIHGLFHMLWSKNRKFREV